jgi:hypothetical protein
MEDDEIEQEDRDWIYLTHDERQVLQKVKNQMMNELLDLVTLQRRKP